MALHAAAVAAVASAVLAAAAGVHGDCRDRYTRPFSARSIWNTAIGSEAQYMPALIYHNMTRERGCGLRISSVSRRRQCPGVSKFASQQQCEAAGCCYFGEPKGAISCFLPAGLPPTQFHNDREWFVLAKDTDEEVPWLNQGDWGPDDKCKVTGRQVKTLKLPHNFTTASNGLPANHMGNNGLGILMPDNRTLVQTQPAYRCEAGGPLLSRYHSGAPQPFPWEIDILSDGNLGAHGGSGLSAFGGSIRSGELAPDAPPIAHSIHLQLFAHDYYFGDPNATCYPNPICTYRWPAIGSDSATFADGSDQRYNGTNPYLAPGSLLAIPPADADSVKTVTTPGAKIKQALIDYGGYLVDDTAGDSAGLGFEAVVDIELQRDYNITVRPNINPGTPFFDDLLAIFRALNIVTNNGIGRVGGGGTPRRPPPPPICGAESP